jgi:hypothetical protein
MPFPGTVTIRIAQLKAGDADAAQHLWNRYFRPLVGLARQRLHGQPRAIADEEDIALSAFDSFCRGVNQERFRQLADHDDLWQLLVMLTARKACRLLRHERWLKRGGGAVRHVSAPDEEEVVEVIGRELKPAFATQMAEECSRLLDQLGGRGTVGGGGGQEGALHQFRYRRTPGCGRVHSGTTTASDP